MGVAFKRSIRKLDNLGTILGLKSFQKVKIKVKLPPKPYRCINPMLADANKEHLTKKTENRQYYLQEKYDGTRGLLYVRDGAVRGFVGRYCGADMVKYFPEMVAEAEQLNVSSCTLDGEITFFRGGIPFFLSAKSTKKMRDGATPRYMVFDIIELNGTSLRSKPLKERLKILNKIIPSGFKYIKVIKTYDDPIDYPNIYKRIVARKGEGVMLKQKDSKYVYGSRKHWIKIKKEQTEDCIVCGITRGTGRRACISARGNPRDMFGALILGQYHRGNLIWVGNVGSGLSDDIIKSFYDTIMPMDARPSPFGYPVPAALKYIAPKIVVEVKCLERTSDGKLRMPVFIRVRDDKLPADCKF